MAKILDRVTHIFNRVDTTEDGCWLFAGNQKADGYCQIRVDTDRMEVHRWSYIYFRGKIPKGYQIDHLCKVKNCINPCHLEAVTPLENVRRSHGVFNSDGKMCIHGHRLTKDNLVKHGKRREMCKTCNNINRKRHYDKAKAKVQGVIDG